MWNLKRNDTNELAKQKETHRLKVYLIKWHHVNPDFQGGAVIKDPPDNAGDPGSIDRWVGKIPWRRKWQPTPVFLPGESHGQRSLVGYSPWGGKELDMTEQLTHHTDTHTQTHRHTDTHTFELRIIRLLMLRSFSPSCYFSLFRILMIKANFLPGTLIMINR